MFTIAATAHACASGQVRCGEAMDAPAVAVHEVHQDAHMRSFPVLLSGSRAITVSGTTMTGWLKDYVKSWKPFRLALPAAVVCIVIYLWLGLRAALIAGLVWLVHLTAILSAFIQRHED